MDSEIDFDCTPFFRLYKNGRFERLPEEANVPPSHDPQNAVVSKDMVVSPGKSLSLRIYLPQKAIKENKKKLPLLVYFHGGCFIFHTAFNPTYNTFLTSAVSAADCIAVSVDYRRAPEHPIPAAYEDAWDALKWVFTHITGSGPDPWLNEYADFNRVSLAGDSAGANISHHMAMKAMTEPGDVKIFGIVLVHPYFWSKLPIDEEESKDVTVREYYDKFWEIASPGSVNGVDDPWYNVVGSDSVDLSGLGCERVLVMVAGKDALVRQGFGYAAKLERSGWGGKVEVFQSEGEMHVFHLKNPHSHTARNFVQRFAEFVKGETC